MDLGLQTPETISPPIPPRTFLLNDALSFNMGSFLLSVMIGKRVRRTSPWIQAEVRRNPAIRAKLLLLYYNKKTG